MNTLIKNRRIVEDALIFLDDETDLPGGDTPCVVPLARWQGLLGADRQADRQADAQQTEAQDAPADAAGTAERDPTPPDDGRLPQVGVLLPNDVDVADIWPQIGQRPVIALSFPAFGDGRAYSQARVLRQRYGFGGEIRATGAAVTRDQIAGMARCGIDSLALREDQNAEECLRAFDDFSTAYQPACDDVQAIWQRRRAG